MAKRSLKPFRQMRLEAGFATADEPARLVGVSAVTWCSWERGDYICPIEHWEAIAKLFSERKQQPWEDIYNRLRDAFIPPKEAKVRRPA